MTVYTILTDSDLLPKWLLFVSVKRDPGLDQVGFVSAYNVIQCYTSLWGTRRVYSEAQASVTPLSARTFGTWTALSAYLRLYAALHIHDATAYQIAFTTFVVAWIHFASEWLVYRTAKPGPGLAGPAIVATTTLSWMWLQWNYYNA